MNMLHVSGVEDRGVESEGEDVHQEVRFAGKEGIGIEIGNETGIENENEIGREKEKGTEGPDAKEKHLRKGEVRLGGRCN